MPGGVRMPPADHAMAPEKETLLPIPSPAAIFRPLPEGGVLFSTETEVYFGVGVVGARIWELLPPATRSVEEMVSFRSFSRMAWSRTWHRLRREIRRYGRSAPKLLKLGLRDWKDLLRAQLALARAQREMHSLPTGGMVRDEDVPVGISAGDRVDDARRIALAVNRAAQFGFCRPRCLVKSRALRKMLDEAGISGAQVRIGVQLSQGRFRAHAWVEYGGQVVGDDPATVAQYAPMPGLRVAEIE
jgi:hypothetical protein